MLQIGIKNTHIVTKYRFVYTRHLLEFGENSCVILGTGSKWITVALQSICEDLVGQLEAALPSLQSFIACNITGSCAGDGKVSPWKYFITHHPTSDKLKFR